MVKKHFFLGLLAMVPCFGMQSEQRLKRQDKRVVFYNLVRAQVQEKVYKFVTQDGAEFSMPLKWAQCSRVVDRAICAMGGAEGPIRLMGVSWRDFQLIHTLWVAFGIAVAAPANERAWRAFSLALFRHFKRISDWLMWMKFDALGRFEIDHLVALAAYFVAAQRIFTQENFDLFAQNPEEIRLLYGSINPNIQALIACMGSPQVDDIDRGFTVAARNIFEAFVLKMDLERIGGQAARDFSDMTFNSDGIGHAFQNGRFVGIKMNG